MGKRESAAWLDNQEHRAHQDNQESMGYLVVLDRKEREEIQVTQV